jgi:uncharacterized protein YndB with AHSA1/START domain
MEAYEKTAITLQATVNAGIEKVWMYWTTPENIMKWNNASADWHTPRAENNLHTGGSFNYRMEAKDGSMGFDFWGSYEKVILHKQINYVLGDGRKVKISFNPLDKKTEIIEIFEAETENSVELQRTGWQSILDNFKNYVEGI